MGKDYRRILFMSIIFRRTIRYFVLKNQQVIVIRGNHPVFLMGPGNVLEKR